MEEGSTLGFSSTPLVMASLRIFVLEVTIQLSEMEFRKMPTLYCPGWKPGITYATVPVYSIDFSMSVIGRLI